MFLAYQIDLGAVIKLFQALIQEANYRLYWPTEIAFSTSLKIELMKEPLDQRFVSRFPSFDDLIGLKSTCPEMLASA